MIKPQRHSPGLRIQHSLARGLTGYFPIWMGAGSRLQELSRGSKRFDAIQNGTGKHWAVSDRGTVVSFDGSASEHFLHPQLMVNVAAFSVVCVLNATSATSYWGKWSSLETPGSSKQVFMRNSGQVFVRNAADSAEENASAPNWAFGVWQTLVAVVDGTNITVWNDGVAGTPTAFAGPYIPATADTWGIGRGHTNAMNGSISLLKYYDRALTANEIAQITHRPNQLLEVDEQEVAVTAAAAAGNPWYQYAQQAAVAG